ncbi:MAG: chemotaxis protein CheB, partial [Gammaproteobacteria bacterium]|nr:chemotaxis protein CheB [Gammaproteobacteria bacterium]
MGNKNKKNERLGKKPGEKAGTDEKNKPELEKSPSDKTGEQSGHRFPIAGIGASAGGLEAFTELLSHLPDDTGMGFVLIQHLHPEHPSALTEILSRATKMPVVEIEDGMRVAPNHIYIIPPNTYLGILHGVLHLMPRSDIKGQNLPIDYFFRHLAEDLGSMSIGVILSGTASDGVLGLKAISAEGGITIAQDRESAKYDGMPHSAIAAGCVDVVLPPDKIAAELARIAHHPFVASKPAGKTGEVFPDSDDMLSKIFLLLRRQTGNDFTYYKPTTIQRRIRRRMLLHKLDRLDNYVRYLQDNPAEIDQLFHDLLINVTEFFRDTEAFEALAEKVFPMLKDRSAEVPIRIWVPGCSTGEEPYSLAIALLEYLGDSAGNVAIQIFATDIDENAIVSARAGLYPETINQHVSPERLRRFFVRVEGGRYQISKYIREMCVFAVQNVIKDPPFSRLDLISCRNLLIYLGPVLQKKIMVVFHYALKPGGYLLLGSAESISGFSDYYQVVDSKEKIYTKKSVATPQQMDFGGHHIGMAPQPPRQEMTASAKTVAEFNLGREIDKLLMDKFTPPAVAINDDMDILQFRGRTGAYLESPPGEATLKILKMAREDIMLELNGVIKKALSSGAPASKQGIRIKRDDRLELINIEVLPIDGRTAPERFFLVVFEATRPLSIEPPPKPKKETGKGKPEDPRVRELEQELAATKEYLQSVIEQQETSNEELRSANEEVQSSNEELQSINEELETAKEELQSTNEELATVNDELGTRNQELDQSNNDLNNII